MKERRWSSGAVGVLFSGVLLLGYGATAHALSSYSTTIGGAGCATCFGSVYTLGLQEVGSGGGNTTYNVTYSVNTSGYTGQGSGLDAIAFKITNNSSNIVLPLPSVSGVNSFSSLATTGLNANGCSGGASAGFICGSSANVGGVAVPNGTYTFNINGLKLTTGALFTKVTDWSIKALYVDENGQQRGITSEKGVVPIPGTLLMFGLGFAGMVYWRTRQLQF